MQSRIMLWAAAAAASFCLNGCGSIATQTPTLTSDASSYKNYYSDGEMLNLKGDFYLHPLPLDILQYKEIKDRWGKNIQWAPPTFRDYVQNDLMKRSDQICSVYLTRLTHAFVVGNAGTSIIQNIAKLALAPALIANTALQGSITGITTTASVEVLQHNEFRSIMKRIISKREIKRAEIKKLQTANSKGVGIYSLSRAVYDAEEYHNLCNYATQYASGEETPKPSEPKK